MELGSLQTAAKSVQNCREDILENNRAVTVHFLVVSKRILHLLFDLDTYFK